MKKITKEPFVQNFLNRKYRDFLLKPALKIINKNQKNALCVFWTIPFDSICRSIILNGFYEHELLRGMCSLGADKNGIALDIGANIGNHSLFFAKNFFKVVSFEPYPNNCFLFKANVFLNNISNITLVEKALSNQNKTMGIDKGDSKNTNNSITELINDQQIVVELVRGDEEIEGLKLNHKISLVKIDVEGHEPLVVEGLRNTLISHKPIVCWEAFSKEDADKTKFLLSEMGYQNFYHLTTNKYRSPFLNKMVKSFSGATYLVEMDKCLRFDGMNVAAINALI